MKRALLVLVASVAVVALGVVGYHEVAQARGADESDGTPWIGAQVRTWPLGGAQVLFVIADSPADEAGLKAGDIVTAVDGEEVRSVGDLVKAVRGSDVGDELELTVLRDGEEAVITVTVGERPRPAQPTPGGPLAAILDGVPREKLFDHFLGSEISLLDAEGNVVVLEATAGTVTALTEDSLTIAPNDPGVSERTYDVSELGAALRGLNIGDPVVVLSRQGDDTAIGVTRARGLAGFLGGGLGQHHGQFRMQIRPYLERGLDRFFEQGPEGFRKLIPGLRGRGQHGGMQRLPMRGGGGGQGMHAPSPMHQGPDGAAASPMM